MLANIKHDNSDVNQCPNNVVDAPNQSQDIVVPPQKKHKPKNPPKLHSSDIPFLKILKFYREKGSGYCYLKKASWPLELEKFGGKPVSYSNRKARVRKLCKLGYVIAIRERGNRNKEYSLYLTDDGLSAVDNFEIPKKRKTKNRPSKVKKQALERVKTGPPLNHAERREKHADAIFSKLNREDYEKGQSFQKLIDFGFYPETAIEAVRKYSRIQIYQAWDKTRESGALNRGAYLNSLLKLLNT